MYQSPDLRASPTDWWILNHFDMDFFEKLMKALDSLSRKKKKVFANNTAWSFNGFPNTRLRNLIKGCMWGWTQRALIACKGLQHLFRRQRGASKAFYYQRPQVVIVSILNGTQEIWMLLTDWKIGWKKKCIYNWAPCWPKTFSTRCNCRASKAADCRIQMHLHGRHEESLPQPNVLASRIPGAGYMLNGAGDKLRANTTVSMTIYKESGLERPLLQSR